MWNPLRQLRSIFSKRAGATRAADDLEAKYLAMMPENAPWNFGYKTEWVVVPTCECSELAQALGLQDVRACSWREGYQRVYAERPNGCIFIPPALGPWSVALGHFDIGEVEKIAALITPLSVRFKRAHYFGTHRVSECHAWAKAGNGRLVRAFLYADGAALFDMGERTPEEVELGVGIVGEEQWPDEEHVIQIASAWTFNPTEIETTENLDEVGLCGTIVSPRRLAGSAG